MASWQIVLCDTFEKGPESHFQLSTHRKRRVADDEDDGDAH